MMRYLIKDNKSQAIITYIVVLTMIVVLLLISFLGKSYLAGQIVSEKVSASIPEGIKYSSELEVEDESTLKIWVISSSILKILIGIAVLIIAIAILIREINKK